MARSSELNVLLAAPLLVSALAGAARAQCEALLFDGADDLATVPNGSGDFDMGSALTLEAWVRIDQSQTGAFALAGRFSPSGGYSWAFGSSLSNPTTLVFAVSVPNTDAVFAPGEWPADGAWRHYAATYDGSVMELYVDGQSVAQSTHGTGGPSSPVEALILGRWPAFTFFGGALDEVRVWNVVRTATEIQQTYMQPLVGDEPGLVGYYKLDEGGGDVLVDGSSSGNDGFLGASPGPGPDDPTRIPDGLPFDPCAGPGTPFCFGDGSGSVCPCGNAGGSGAGCANSTGAGAVLDSGGSDSAGADDLTFQASALLPGQPALLFAGHNAVNGGDGIPFGDGLRCAGQNVVRLGVRVPDANGSASWGPGLGAAGGWSAGDTRYFQAWYRDPSGGPCGAGFNLSNGVEVTFTP